MILTNRNKNWQITWNTKTHPEQNSSLEFTNATWLGGAHQEEASLRCSAAPSVMPDLWLPPSGERQPHSAVQGFRRSPRPEFRKGASFASADLNSTSLPASLLLSLSLTLLLNYCKVTHLLSLIPNIFRHFSKSLVQESPATSLQNSFRIPATPTLFLCISWHGI